MFSRTALHLTFRSRITRGHVALGAYPDAPVNSAAMIATGHRDGPSLWLQTGIHGPEVVGQIAIHRFLQRPRSRSPRRPNRLPHDRQSARIPRLQPPHAAGRRKPQSHLSWKPLRLRLRTARPPPSHAGTRDGSRHAGPSFRRRSHHHTPFCVIYRKDLGEASARSAAFSRAVGSRLQWGSDESWLDGAAFAHFTRAGKPALIVESGGGARVCEKDIGNLHGAITGLCQAIEMLPGIPLKAENVRYGGNAVHLRATASGFWQPLVSPGEDVSAGQPLGRIVGIFGDIVETPKSSFAPGWIGSIRRPFMPIYAGDQVIELVETVSSP